MLELIKGFVRYVVKPSMQNQDNNKNNKPETNAPAKVA